MIVANDTSLCGAILVLVLEFRPGNRAEISHMNRRQNSSRLPGSYEEAISLVGIQLVLYDHHFHFPMVSRKTEDTIITITSYHYVEFLVKVWNPVSLVSLATKV